jgi:energy-coupling factor transporter ATP-binding protein EcfA2
MAPVNISLKRGGRGFITGTSGSGKTTLALRLCEAMPPPLVIVDTKYDPTIGSWAKSNRIKIVRREPDWTTLNRDIVYRPPAEMLNSPPDIDHWLGQAFNARYIPSIYIDEGYDVGAASNRIGTGVRRLWTAGRARGMRLLFGAQRPAWVSRFVISESTAYYIGHLQLDDDRKAIVANTGRKQLITAPDWHYFWYVTPGNSQPTLLKPLDIGEDRSPVSRTALRVERQKKDRRSFTEWLRDQFAA